MKHFINSAIMMIIAVIPATMLSQISFTNQAASLGSLSGSSYEDCAVDMNGDYLDDVVRVTGNSVTIDFQQPDGTFTQTVFPLDVQNPPTWSICAGDIDGNGYNDLLFGNGSRVSFCYANDDGTAYTEDAHPEYIFSQRSTFADIDNDGHLDAFVDHDVDQSHPYRNDGMGNLVLDQTLIETLDVGGNYAAIWVDYDNDWDIDLYITKCRGGAAVGDPQRINLLYQNNGDGTFSSVGPGANMDDGDQSWTTLFEDFDNDGDFDAFTVNHAWANRFMENNGDGTFTDIIESTGIDAGDLGAWNADAGDFDNNGFVDIFTEMADEMYLNNGDGTFTPYDLNFDSGGIGDFNDDGFLDVINGNSLWINDGNDNNWLKVGCEGILSNLNGIGARIEIYGDWGIQIREIRAGESFSPASSLVEHFGLGTATSIDQMIIKWPSGTITTIDNPDINTTHIVPEAGCMADPNEITVNGELNICPGETVELLADAGESYTWNNGEQGQSIDVGVAGTYSVVIWDDEGCASISNTVTVNVLEDETPTIELTGDEVFCEGNEVILTSSIGENYYWSNGDSGQQSIVVSEGGDYFVMIDAICSADQISSESVTLTMLASDAPMADDVVIGAPGTATLSATGENLKWYETETSTDVLGEGETFETDFFDTNISYWVEATAIYGGEMESGAKEDDAGGGGIPSTGGKLFFNVTEPFTLQTVTIYVLDEADSGPGERTFVLYDGLGTEIASHTEYFEVGEHEVDLNFEVPVGTGLSIGCNENDLFRNNGGLSYPYAIGSAGSIYDSTFGTGYYYYFYNWQIQLEETVCPSERVEVSASVVGVNEIDAIIALNIFPNPTSDILNIDFESIETSTLTLDITDIAGKIVYTEEIENTVVGNNTIRIDVSNLASGSYQINFNVAGQTASYKLMVD